MEDALTGHVRDLGGDRWELVVNLPAELRVRDDGRLVRRYPKRSRQVKVRGLRRAGSALDSFRAEISARLFFDPMTLSVAQLLEAWLESEVADEVRPKTRERYTQLVRQHLVPGLGTALAAELEPKQWHIFHRHCRTEGRTLGKGGLSEQTCLHLFHVLHRAYAWAVETGRLKANPLDRVRRSARPSPPARHQATWSTKKVIAAIELAKPTLLYVPAVLAGLGGLRRGEICGLSWEDVVWDAQFIVVRRSVEQTADGLHELPTKTKSGDREVPMPELVMDVLRTHKAEQDEMRLARGRRWNDARRIVCRVDGSAMPPNALSNRWSEWVRRKKLEPYISFHGLRHSYATELYGLGVRTKTVQGRLGHSSPAVTRKLYLHGTDAADVEALRLQEERIAEALSAKDSRMIRDQVADLEQVRARKSCK